jgi:hypothetical protein
LIRQQKFLCSAFEKVKRSLFINENEDIAYWIQSCSSNNGWLTCTPNSRYGTIMDCTDFRMCLLLRLRSHFMPTGQFCQSLDPSKKKFSIDALGHHCLGCPRGGSVIKRHNAVAKLIFRESQASLDQPRYDPKQIVSSAGSAKKPADVYIPDWRNGTGIALDISVVVPTRINRSVNSSSAENSKSDRLELSVDDSYAAKITKHREICRKAGISFEPLTFDAGGFIHENSKAVLFEIARRKAVRFGWNENFVRSCFLTKISIAIQKGNARAIRKHLTALQSHKYFEVDHHLPEYLQLEEF